MPDPIMYAADVAKALGYSLDRFNRHRDALIAQDHMPQPISMLGRARWHRASIEAWLARHHPLKPPRPANGDAPPIAPDDVEAWRAIARAEYGRRT